MKASKSTFYRRLSAVLAMAAFLFVYGAGAASAQDDALSDSAVTPEELGVSDQRVLPGSVFYPFKELWRNVRHIAALSPEADARLDERIASEKLLEARKLSERGARADLVRRAVQGYQKRVENMERNLERSGESQESLRLREKLFKSHLKHAVILDVIGEGRGEEIFEDLEEMRNQVSERVARIMSKARIERLREIADEEVSDESRSAFHGLKALEALKRVEEQVPEEARARIAEVRKKMAEGLSERLEEVPAGERVERLKEYVRSLPGDEARRFEVFEDEEFVRSIPADVRRNLEGLKQETVERFEERFDRITDEQAREKFLERAQQRPEKPDSDFGRRIENKIPEPEIRRRQEEQRQRERASQPEAFDQPADRRPEAIPVPPADRPAQRFDRPVNFDPVGAIGEVLGIFLKSE